MKTLLQYFFLLFFNVTTITIFVHITSVHSRCLEDQQLSLLRFKTSLTFHHTPYSDSYSTKIISWNSSTDCCSWSGVTCSTNGHVVGLNISSETISGGIDNSSSLFDLQHLQNLNLADNHFVGDSCIPSAIGKLTNLRYLNLSDNDYSGEIPIEISHLSRLNVLDISQIISSYGQYDLKSSNLSMLFRNLTELTELYFDCVNLSAHWTDWSQAISNSLPNLRVLSLFSTGLSGPIDESLTKLQFLSVIRLDYNGISDPIPGFFANFSNLRELVLDGNNFSAPVPGFFANFSKLTVLSLRGCSLHGTFPKEIFQVPTLQIIDLSYNEELHGFLPEFSKNGSLSSLVLSWTNFSGSLPESIGQLKMLSTIELSSCNFYGPGSLPESIGQLKMLSTIDLSSCNFYGPIPKSMGNLTQLVHLYMSSNRFNGPIDSIHWENLINLVDLKLDDNQLEGSIPSSLFSLPLLPDLVLSHNQFSGKLRASANISSYLYFLDLSFNHLEGPIPTSIFNFQRLRGLYLSSNNFSGFPFTGPQQLRNLTQIDLSYNSLLIFNGSYSTFPKVSHLDLASTNLRALPYFLRNQSTLHYLDLSENQIQGKIPNWIWSFNLYYLNLSCNSFVTLEIPLHILSLDTIDLHSNQLHGEIPNFLPFARYLDYSRNHFSSSIPIDIGDFLNSTQFFSLSSNNLHGLIPVSLCNASNDLRVLDLSNNSLSGMIPQCLTALGNLRVLNLARNNLTGTISKFEATEDCSLQILELGGNQLGGQFPKSLANCTFLQFLDLGNNEMKDAFPCLLKNISTLRVLVLRSNKFYGHIGCTETYGAWPVLQIIDLAHNNFSGEIPGMSLTRWGAMMATEDDSLSTIRVHEPTSPDVTTPWVDYYFEGAITVTSKGLEMDLVKILSIFTLIDFSCNNFSGPIPTEMGEFKSLYVLNLSSNTFTGEIPPSFGSMRQLESLDLSQNKLSGQIPMELAKLNFLSFLNLSNNQLIGRIPTSTQISTFPKASFTGNEGLWGPPLTEDRKTGLSPPPGSHSNSGDEVDWEVISVEIGFAFGFGIAVGSLVLCKRWSKWYYKTMYNILVKIFPCLEEKFGRHRRHIHINQR